MTRIAILSIPVSDQQRAADFYTRMPGWQWLGSATNISSHLIKLDIPVLI